MKIEIEKEEYDKLLKREEDLINIQKEKATNEAMVEEMKNILLSEEFNLRELPKEEKERLENLSYQDPTAWRKELETLVNKNREEVNRTINEIREKAEVKAKTQTDEEIIKNFVGTSGGGRTFEEIMDELPYGLRKDYEDGKIEIGKFLDGVSKSLGQDPKHKEETVLKDEFKNIKKQGEPSTEAREDQASTEYENIII